MLQLASRIQTSQTIPSFPLPLPTLANTHDTKTNSARSYRSMIPQIKSIIAEGSGTAAGAVRVGVNLNWEKICGCPGNLIYSTK